MPEECSLPLFNNLHPDDKVPRGRRGGQPIRPTTRAGLGTGSQIPIAAGSVLLPGLKSRRSHLTDVVPRYGWTT